MPAYKSLVATLAATCLITPALLFLPGSANAAATFAAPSVSPSKPLLGERVTLTGAVGSPGKRPVRLQTRVEGSWVNAINATTTSTGRYAFTLQVTKNLNVRVVAPATNTKPVRRSAPLALRPTSTVTSLLISGSRITSTAAGSVSPARAGRKVRLQSFVPATATWKTLEVKTQTSATTVTWTLHDLPSTPVGYRVLAGPWNGAPQYAGPTVTFSPPVVDSNLPDVVLATTDAAPVTSKELYVPGTLTIDGGTAHPMQIKGRGNSTWGLPKKPYRIKLDTKASLLGLESERDWVLLANYYDRSALRNWTAFEIARASALGWTPSSKFVDVTLNGVDLGLYQLVEQVEATSTKVQLADGGLLLEIDQRRLDSGDPGFTSSRGLEIAYKDPDDPDAEQQTAVKALVDEFESVLYSVDWLDPTTGYARFVDLTSFADWALVNEAMLNLDSDFFSSVFLTWDPAGKLAMGPVWDFDLSSGFESNLATGCCEETTGWWLRSNGYTGRGWQHNQHWLARMAQDPAFVALLKQRWNSKVGPAVGAVRNSLNAQQDLLSGAADRNWAIWKYSTTPSSGTGHAADPAGEVNYLSTWLGSRAAWIADQFD